MQRISAKFFILIGVSITVIIMGNSGGSPGGKTGSPGDKKVSCTSNGGCHGPKAPNYQTMISTTIPASGYVPGTEYTITISGTQAGKSRFGFEIVAEDSNAIAKGTFVSNTDVAINGNRATHRFQSTSGAGSKTWNVVWKAPAASGKLKFYAAVLAANDNGTTAGDEVILDSLEVKQAESVSIKSILESKFNIYPNPVMDVLSIQGKFSENARLSITNAIGKTVYSGVYKEKLNVSALPAGNYTLFIEEDNVLLRKAFLKL